MKTLYKPIATILLTAVFAAGYAQQSPMPYAKLTSSVSEIESGTVSDSGPVQFRPNIPNQPHARASEPIPVSEQIHTPIRWYALELADDKDYWENVNPERVWLELEVGLDIANTEVVAFLNTFQLSAPVKRSMHPNLTNFYVFERPGTTAEQFVEMALSARSLPGVLFLEPSAIRKGNMIPNDPYWSSQWGPYAIYSDVAWDNGIGGQSWNVMAVIDDAVAYNHEDLKDQVTYGYDYGNDDSDPGLDGAEQTHGTHVTGIMAATINNSKGVAGMCNDTVFFAKVTDETYFTEQGSYSGVAIINSVYDIATIDRVTVVNMSLGGGAPSAADEQAYNALWNSGKLPVVASGNDGMGTVSYPAAYQACMAVGSVGSNGTNLFLASYSNYGADQEVSAPGGESQTGYGILSTMPNNQYDYMEGTSMACPMVAGLAGLMKSVNPGLTNVDIRNMINATCLDLGEPGWDQQFGYGMVNAQAAVEMALNSVSVFENKRPGALTIYPNPSNQQFWIKGAEEFGSGNVEMYDLTGKLVKREPVTAQNIQPISVSDLPEGVYVVQMRSDAKLISGKFVKSR